MGQGENAVRLYFRLLLIATPGFSDHFPCDYERALREELSADPRELVRIPLRPREPFTEDEEIVICG